MAGLVCDGNFNTAAMNLYKYNNIYFPDEDFYNCNIFPVEWIEIFVEEVLFLIFKNEKRVKHSKVKTLAFKKKRSSHTRRSVHKVS